MILRQRRWLEDAGRRIPELFKAIKDGNPRARAVLGERVVNGRTVRLSLLVEVVDPGRNPLSSHACSSYPANHEIAIPDDMEILSLRKRKPRKRWK